MPDTPKTLCLTAMNPANELCIWAYRLPQSKYGTETIFKPFYRIGDKDQTLAWNETSKFLKVDAPAGDFEITFSFHSHNKGANNWDNWALRFEESSDNFWALRADGYSVETFTGSTVTYSNPKTWKEFDDKDVDVKIIRQGASIHVSATVDGKDIYGVLSKSSPKGALTVYLGGESTYLDVKKMTVASLKEREIIGSVTNYGAYKDAFNTKSGASKSFDGDFHTRYSFNNFHSFVETKNWNNFIIKNTINGKTGFIRADAYRFDSEGNFTFDTSWGDDWETFIKMLKQAKVDIDIERIGSTITYICDIQSYDGLSGKMVVTQDGITAQSIQLSLTEEASQIDLLEIMDLKTVETGIIEDPTSVATVKDEKTIVYPTITSSIVKVVLNKEDGIATLHASNGVTIAKKKAVNGAVEFDLSNQPSGVYVVVAEGKVEKIIRK